MRRPVRTSRAALALALASSVAALASVSRADEAPDAPPAKQPPAFEAIDFDRIPRGSLPALPAADGAPAEDAPDPAADGVTLQKVKPSPRRHGKGGAPKRKMAKGLAAKTLKVDLVEIAPDHPEMGALFQPDSDNTEFAGESVSPLPCAAEPRTTPLRWETLTLGSDGAKVAFKDLWFYSASCSVKAGATAEATFAPVAWSGGKAWLYALRDDRSVTFLFPRATDVSVDAAVGVPVTVRGGFTRVSLPLGRWGSTSLVAHLPSLDLDVPPRPAAATRAPGRKGQAVQAPSAPPAPTSTGDPIEVAVELVQTMSEASPTLLVRRGAVEAHVERDARD